VKDLRDIPDCLFEGRAIREIAANDANRGRGEVAQVRRRAGEDDNLLAPLVQHLRDPAA